jgi:hypothetical protein
MIISVAGVRMEKDLDANGYSPESALWGSTNFLYEGLT